MARKSEFIDLHLSALTNTHTHTPTLPNITRFFTLPYCEEASVGKKKCITFHHFVGTHVLAMGIVSKSLIC